MEEMLYDLMLVGGSCYKHDLITVEAFKKKDNGNESALKTTSAKVSRAIAKGYIENIGKPSPAIPHEIVKLTSRGITYLGEKGKDVSLYAPIKNSYTASNIIQNMRDVRTLLIMRAADVKAVPPEKPELSCLYAKLSGNLWRDASTGNYANNMSVDEIHDVLSEGGVFYTDKEVRVFLKNITGKNEAVYSTRFSGLYISSDKMLIVFATKIEKEKFITYSSSAMEDILVSLNPLIKLTDVRRDMSSFGPKKIAGDMFTPVKAMKGDVYALILCNGYEMVYSSVVNNRYGRNELGSKYDAGDKRSLMRNKKDKDRKKSSEAEHMKRKRLTGDTDQDYQMFRRVFITPFNLYGLQMLNTLLSLTVEDWFDSAQALFAANKSFDIPGDNRMMFNQLYPAKDLSNEGAPSIFMPVPEINELRKIYESKDDHVSIVSPEQLHEAIAHAIRKDHAKFYYISDVIENEAGEFTPEVAVNEDVGIYAPSGYLKGREILVQNLAKRNLEYSESEYRKLPTMFNQTTSDFYNSIYSRETNIKDVVNFLPPHQAVEKKKYYHKKKIKVSFEVSEEEYKLIKLACSIQGKSANQMFRSLILPHAKSIQEGVKK